MSNNVKNKALRLSSNLERVLVKRRAVVFMDGQEYNIYITNGRVVSIYVVTETRTSEEIIIKGTNLGTSIKKVFGVSKAEFFNWLDKESEILEIRDLGGVM